MKNYFKILICSMMFSVLGITFSSAGPVPDTGQTKCYNNTREIPCPNEGEAFYGQDAQYNINPQSYTKLDANGNDLLDDAENWVMVRDNVTGLIWESKTDDGSIHNNENTYTWQDAQDIFITEVNNESFGGFSDWRLPTVRELKSIVNSNKYNRSIDQTYFHKTMSSYYWSSTIDAGDINNAWRVGFSSGHVINRDKSDNYYVRAVRGSQSETFEYLDNQDGTVTDPSTGLMWQQASAGSMTWGSALSYCEALNLAGYSDWRLPNDKELLSIVDYNTYNPSINSSEFSGTVSSFYWSSTTYVYDSAYSWCLFFSDGSVDSHRLKSSSFYVRAVRGGQSQSSDHLVIVIPDQVAIWESGTNQTIAWDTREIPGNVKISLSREGGKDGTYETIVSSAPNDGDFEWTVTGPDSVNCMIKIELLEPGYENKGTTQGLFSIIQKEYKKGDVNGDKKVNLIDAIIGLQIVTGIVTEPEVNLGADVDGDGKIGLAEVVYVLKEIAE